MFLPSHLIQTLRQHPRSLPPTRLHLRDRHLRIDRDIPHLQAAGTVHERKHARLDRAPRRVVHDILARDVQQGRDDLRSGARACRGRHGGRAADLPQLDGPVEAGGEDEVAEIDGPMRGVESDGHDGGGVAAVGEALVDAGLSAGASVAVAGVEGPFFGADEEIGGVGGREGHAGGGEVFGFGRGRGGEFEVFLRLREHVDRPAADDAVGRAGDDVVGVLRADDGDGVDGVCVAGAG